jgi:hypothetical protein
MTVPTELLPRIETFEVGEVAGTPAALEPVIGGLKLLGRAEADGLVAPLFGMVDNLGDEPFTFSVEESDDDGKVDAYSGIEIRNLGSEVTSVVVVPGARVVFAIEPGELTAGDSYLRFKADAVSKAQHGRLAIVSWTDDLQRWESRAEA